MASSELKEELSLIRSFCSRFVPNTITFNEKTGKHKKEPLLKNWKQITPEDSTKSLTDFPGHRYFIFLTGKETGLFVIDIDRKNNSREFHVGKIDGVEAFEMWCGPVNAPDTFTSRSIGGGYHKVYKLTDEVANCIKTGYPVPDALIETLYEETGFMYGEGCSIIHKMLPQPPPTAVVNLIVNNYYTQVNINNTVVNSAKLPSSEDVNFALNCNVKWIIKVYDNNMYKLEPDTLQCCVDITAKHTNTMHSCVCVYRNSVVLMCYSHGKRLLTGNASKRLRALFFNYKDTPEKGVSELVDELRAMAFEEQLAREDGMVLKRINSLIPVYEQVDTYDAFLKIRFDDNAQLRAFPKRINDMLVYMKQVGDVKFPFIKRDRTYIGFRNGMLNIVSGEFEYYGNLPHGVSPRHYIDQVCQFDDLETPLFDRIFGFQLETDDPEESALIYTYFLGIIGRLFYEVASFDSFDVMPFVVGDTNTGKSTLIDIITAMFSPGSVGNIDSSHETIFGLKSLHDKELILASEMPDNMAQQLASDKFKKMVCGEMVTVPIKHSDAKTVKWKVPMLMCGNDYPRYRDERGSVSKRLIIFSFTRYVEEQDGSLKPRIIAEELSRLVVRCLLAYRYILERTGTGGFWTKCPSYFKETISGMHESTDYIHMFLTIAHGDNVWYDRTSNCRKAMYFVQQRDQTLWMEEFKKKFYDYMRFRHPLVKHRWSKDYSAFKRLCYVVERRHMCRACKQPARRNCCENYSSANRSHIDVIMNIVCVEEYVGPE